MAPHDSTTADLLLVGRALAGDCEKFLGDLGYACHAAADAREAEGLLRSRPFLALIGILSPAAGGWSLFGSAKESQSDCRGLAVVSGPWETYFPEIALRDFPHHFLSASPALDLRELAVTLEKIRSGDIFGMDRYDIPVHESFTVGEGEGRYPPISKIKEFYLIRGIPSRLAERAESVIHELVTNARKAHSLVGGAGRVCLEYGVGDRSFGVSVSDPGGALESRRLFSSINRAIQDRSVVDHPGRGAGIGLMMAFKTTNGLIFNVSPNRRTEAIAIFHRRESSGKALKMGHSLHYFRGREP